MSNPRNKRLGRELLDCQKDKEVRPSIPVVVSCWTDLLSSSRAGSRSCKSTGLSITCAEASLVLQVSI